MQKVWHLIESKEIIFALDKGKILGFIVSKSGIYIDPEIIEEIK